MGSSIPGRTQWVDHLRSFITLLVIAHHAALAYTSFSVFNKDAYILSTHPVVDVHRWSVLDIFAGYNDSFFMPLMFLISGMFTLPSLQRKGPSLFIAERCRRLFIPFLIAVTLFMCIAYYPAWLLSGKPGSIRDYLIDFFTVEAWPVGPPWFIWVLFLFNVIAAWFFPVLMPLLTKTGRVVLTRPFTAVLFFFILTILLYVPAAMLFGGHTWTGIGPFDFQKSRMLLYFGYFLMGAVIGPAGAAQGLFTHESPLVKAWPFWVAGSIGAYLLQINTSGVWLHPVTFALTTAVTNIAALTVFKTFPGGPSRIWQSLSASAYGMYLVHYVFVVWCQYGLLDIDLPAGVKFLIVFIFSTLTSWLAAGAFTKKGPPAGYNTKAPASAGA